MTPPIVEGASTGSPVVFFFFCVVVVVAMGVVGGQKYPLKHGPTCLQNFGWRQGAAVNDANVKVVCCCGSVVCPRRGFVVGD